MALDLQIAKRENTASLRDKFIEQPCNILNHNLLKGKAFNSAMNYIPTARIKMWKPKDETMMNKENTDKFAYCYIDNDADNKNQDALMQGPDACSRSNDVLFNNQFVVDVFSDNAVENTRKMPYKKCVLKIEKDQVNVDSLQRFWDSVGSQDCDQLYYPLQEKNQEYVGDLDSLVNDVKANEAELNMRESESRALYSKIADMETLLRNCSQNKTAIATHLEDRQTKLNGIRNKYATNETVCVRTIDDQTNTKNTCEAALKNTRTALSQLLSELKRGQELYNEASSKLRINTDAYNLMVATFNARNAEYIKLVGQYQELLPMWIKCNEVQPKCVTDLANATTDKNKLQSQFDALTQQLSTCLQQLDACTTDLKVCDTAKAQNLILRNDTKDLYFVCNTDRDGMKRSIAELEATKLEQEKTIRLLELLPCCSNCDPERAQASGLKNEIEEIMKWCKIYTDRNTVYAAGVIKTNADNILKSAADANNCNSISMNSLVSQSQLYGSQFPTLVPKQEEKPVISATSFTHVYGMIAEGFRYMPAEQIFASQLYSGVPNNPVKGKQWWSADSPATFTDTNSNISLYGKTLTFKGVQGIAVSDRTPYDMTINEITAASYNTIIPSGTFVTSYTPIAYTYFSDTPVPVKQAAYGCVDPSAYDKSMSIYYHVMYTYQTGNQYEGISPLSFDSADKKVLNTIGTSQRGVSTATYKVNNCSTAFFSGNTAVYLTE